ncbi:hypothetical protein E2C01_075184 [Portunus trituberculatus]|uniref:Uncharacterized protein n=1 Tax=Portunus trituberculatus TaxID=210409 RepID=A0A5B7IA32_PORTR|nr:hypothetical protein [Portunus trituberculatus]
MLQTAAVRLALIHGLPHCTCTSPAATRHPARGSNTSSSHSACTGMTHYVGVSRAVHSARHSHYLRCHATLGLAGPSRLFP